jgi:hypothetical protein
VVGLESSLGCIISAMLSRGWRVGKIAGSFGRLPCAYLSARPLDFRSVPLEGKRGAPKGPCPFHSSDSSSCQCASSAGGCVHRAAEDDCRPIAEIARRILRSFAKFQPASVGKLMI